MLCPDEIHADHAGNGTDGPEKEKTAGSNTEKNKPSAKMADKNDGQSTVIASFSIASSPSSPRQSSWLSI